ncbi:acyl-CoA dehydrogenase family protein [Hoeflea sp.]|uniref:acyl-CoA dehydrogenase family protein n=1 Tax=Hoeflea sp. TaxID=1940281 RepID=UPI0025BE0BF7|nr:acyl-CoA dehydrogenase family protein [Hoeflea sp.]
MHSLGAKSYLTDDEIELQRMARRFMENEVAAATPEMEATGMLSMELMREMGRLGLLGTFFPEKYGGGGFTITSRAIVSEEMARINAGLDISIFADIVLFARAIARHGTEEQKQKYLEPVLRGEKIGSMAITEPKGGSDALSARSQARRDGDDYIVNGHKIFITNSPVADFILVIARTDGKDREINGGTWFILERGVDGLSTSKPFEKLGMKSSPTGEVFIDNVRVPAENILGEVNRGFYYLMESLDVERVLEGASNIGIAQACLDAAAKYAQERVVFGKRISQYQLIQEKIAEMATGIELSRTMLYRLMRAVEREEVVTCEAAMLKLYSSRMAVQASSDAIQIFGGNGYMEEYPVARYYRDAKHHEIGAGTTEIQKIIIAREILKQYGSA